MHKRLLNILTISSFILVSYAAKAQRNTLAPYYIQFFQDTASTETKYIKDFKTGTHRILFKGGFYSDSVRVYINNKLQESLFLASDKSTDNTSMYYDFKCLTKYCDVKLLVGKECVNFVFVGAYKLANISRHEGEWYITFSNYYWFSE